MTKSNGKNLKILTIIMTLIFAAAGVIYGYGMLNGRVCEVEKKVEKAEDTRERVIRVEEGVDYLKKAVDRIETRLTNEK
jgi:flagellar basal body-associated protein FliL